MRDFTVNTSRVENGLIDVSVDVNFKNIFDNNAHPLKKTELAIASHFITGVEVDSMNGIFDTHRIMSFSRIVGGARFYYDVEFEEPIDWIADSEEIKKVINERIRTINNTIKKGEYKEICRYDFCNCDIVKKTKFEESDDLIKYISECEEGHKLKTYEKK